jgi:hypothetical protein
VAQVEERLSSKCEALRSHPSILRSKKDSSLQIFSVSNWKTLNVNVSKTDIYFDSET